MDVAIDHAVEQDRIRALIEDWARAARAKDVRGLLAHHATDLVVFDCHSALQIEGLDAFRQHVAACFAEMPGPMIMEVRDLHITVGADLAFCRYLVRCGTRGADDEEHACCLRVTLCLGRRNGAWTALHVHCSAPFDPESGRALLDLQPPGAS